MEKKKSSIAAFVLLLVLVLAGTWYREHDGARDGLELTASGIAENVRNAREGQEDVSKQLRGLEIPYLLDKENNQIVEHMGYTLSYNEEMRIPNWVAYELLDSELYGGRNSSRIRPSGAARPTTAITGDRDGTAATWPLRGT